MTLDAIIFDVIISAFAYSLGLGTGFYCGLLVGRRKDL